MFSDDPFSKSEVNFLQGLWHENLWYVSFGSTQKKNIASSQVIKTGEKII